MLEAKTRQVSRGSEGRETPANGTGKNQAFSTCHPLDNIIQT